MCPSNCNRFWDIARYWSKIVNFSYPLAFDAPVRGVPVGIAPPRMAWLPHGEKISKISLFILVQFTNVTDGQTNRRTDRQTPGDGNSRAMHSIARQKSLFLPHFCFPWGRPWGNHAKFVWMKREFDAYKLSRSMYHLSSTVSQLFEPQVQKIAVFTYRSPHFCFSWRRPCDYHAICCTDGKTIQCLPNPSQHVPIYLQ